MAKWTPKKKRESGVEDGARKYMKSIGGGSWKFTSPNNRGVPDRIFSHPNCGSFFVEFKKEGKQLGDLQDMMCDEMEGFGCRVYRAVDTLEKAKAVIDKEVYGF